MRVWGLVGALVGLGAGCGKGTVESGTIHVVTPKLSAADVRRVAVTISGPGIPTPIVQDLTLSSGQWTGTISGIPAGTARTFAGDAFDAGGARVYGGKLSGVLIEPGRTATVMLVLQQVTPPPPFANRVPIIHGLVLSSEAVAPGQTVTIDLSARDDDAGDVLVYDWSATLGSFDDAAVQDPVWTAPATEGAAQLTVQVSDGRGGTRSLGFAITVSQSRARGGALVVATLNTWPVLSQLVATPGRVDGGGVVSLSTSAFDPEQAALQFAWSDGGGACAGTFDVPSSPSPTWTAPAVAPAGRRCTLSVAVSDGAGGSTSGAITIEVGPAPTPNVAPEIELAYQSATTGVVGTTMTFRVQARDPEGQALTFAWSATGGTLATPTTTATTSEVIWTVDCPSLVEGGEPTPAVVRARVTDAQGASTTQEFVASCTPGLPPAPPPHPKR
ncbi:MAG: hypothetical protein IT371_12060 [Deltaproteobacteria bacterium]|nr:hypothetical protein [Deltaproteobacteria bacterium]